MPTIGEPPSTRPALQQTRYYGDFSALTCSRRMRRDVTPAPCCAFLPHAKTMVAQPAGVPRQSGTPIGRMPTLGCHNGDQYAHRQPARPPQRGRAARLRLFPGQIGVWRQALFLLAAGALRSMVPKSSSDFVTTHGAGAAVL